MAVYFPEVNNIILLTSRAGNKLERETGLSTLPREVRPPQGGQINQFSLGEFLFVLKSIICFFINLREINGQNLFPALVRLVNKITY